MQRNDIFLEIWSGVERFEKTDLGGSDRTSIDLDGISGSKIGKRTGCLCQCGEKRWSASGGDRCRPWR